MHEVQDLVAVGSVSTRSARIWFRSSRPGPHEITVRGRGDDADGGHRSRVTVSGTDGADATCALTVEGLQADREYEFAVKFVGEGAPAARVGEGRFRTAPERGAASGDPFSIAVLSCHQPFDEDGAVREDARQMLGALLQVLKEKNTRLVLTIGDQMYSDLPESRSLFDEDYFRRIAPPGTSHLLGASADTVRALYQQRYRAFFALPEWQELLANHPCYPMLDDHEIVDNWGSDPAHSQEAWRALREGARAAYVDYQASRVDPRREVLPSFHYRFEYGGVAGFMADFRTPRDFGAGTLLGRAQLEELARFFEEEQEADTLLLATTLPLFHVPDLALRIGAALTKGGDDFSDRAAHPVFADEYDEVCRLLRRHRETRPGQELILVSGDIHIGVLSALRWGDAPPAHQLIASGITHSPDGWVTKASELAVRAAHTPILPSSRDRPDARLVGEPSAGNPYRGLHFGLLEFDPGASGAIAARMSVYGHEDGEPFVACSTPLPRALSSAGGSRPGSK